MNLYEAQETFKKMFTDKLVTFSFDENCIRQCECIMTDGLPNLMHHVEYRAVKVSVEGIPDQYVPINPHREVMSWASYKKLMMSKDEVCIHPDTIQSIVEVKEDPERKMEYDSMISDLCYHSGMSKEAIESKLK